MIKKGSGSSQDRLPTRLGPIVRSLKEALQHGPDEFEASLRIHLERAPDIIIPILESLVDLPTVSTVQVLRRLLPEQHDKQVQRAAKKTLYKLEQKGIHWEEEPRGRSVLRRPAQAPLQGYMGPPDGTGSMVVVLVRPRSGAGIRVVFAIINDEEGIQHFDVGTLTRVGLKEFMSTFASGEFPVVETDERYCVHLLHEASGITHKAGRSLPAGYRDAERDWEDPSREDRVPIVYSCISRNDVRDRPVLLKQSGSLHTVSPFSTWFLPEDSLKNYVDGIRQSQESRIVLSPQQRDAQIHEIYLDAFRELFGGDKRLLWKGRLEHAAYVLWKTGRRDDARAAVCAAVDVEDSLNALHPNPFLWNLLLKSLYGLMERQQQGTKDTKDSLIITP